MVRCYVEASSPLWKLGLHAGGIIYTNVSNLLLVKSLKNRVFVTEGISQLCHILLKEQYLYFNGSLQEVLISNQNNTLQVQNKCTGHKIYFLSKIHLKYGGIR